MSGESEHVEDPNGGAGGVAPSASASSDAAAWRTNLGLFIATVASVCMTGMLGAIETPKGASFTDTLVYAFQHITAKSLISGAQFAGTLLTILVAHELGHYIAARIHKVDASLPFFIPMPLISPFGTMGAVIRMRGVIPTRRALLDIGASGPLAGLAFAIPLYAWGVSHSTFVPLVENDNLTELGESVLIKVVDHFLMPPAPEGMIAVYSPVAYAAWGGFFVTMINLLPVGQLDGGHVAYALFGPKQNRYALIVHRAMLVFFFVIIAGHVGRDFAAHLGFNILLFGRHIANALPWLVWFQLLAVLGAASARAKREAEERDDGPGKTLSVRTRIVATIGLLVLASMDREHGSWLITIAFFLGLGLLIAMEMKWGVLRKHDSLDHPPTGSDPLDGLRKAIAIGTLVLFALLFMPEPFSF